MTKYRKAGHLMGALWYAACAILIVKAGFDVFRSWRVGLLLDGGAMILCIFGLILFMLKCLEWSLENLEQLLKR